MKLTVKQPFAWAHGGVTVEHFAAGQEIDTDDADLIAVAAAEGWAMPEGGKADAPAANKARKAPPENK